MYQPRKARPFTLGSLENLSLSMRRLARNLAASQLLLVVYDNINMVWKVAEQIIGRTGEYSRLPDVSNRSALADHDTVQTHNRMVHAGRRFGCGKEMLSTSELNEQFDHAPPLTAKDLIFTSAEDDFFSECLIHTVCRIAIQQGGALFLNLEKDVQTHQPKSDHCIEVHKSDIYPGPALNINESYREGNADVMDAINQELDVDTSKPEFGSVLRLTCGDQLTIARLRSIIAARAGNEGGASAMRWALFIPGLFHYKIAATHGILLAHLGLPNRELKNPGSLGAHNNLLQRKPIVATSLPNFRTCRDLIFVSLYARILHCLLLVSGKESLADLAEGLTWANLRVYATSVVDKYADSRLVDELRRGRAMRGATDGDIVFENALIFLRDALVLREFTDAIKIGDSGRVLTALKQLAFIYRGYGRNKYAQEVLYLVHNFTHV